jgi:signal transduction histidine kinase
VRFIIGTDQRHLDGVLGEFNRTLGISLATFAGALILAAGLLIAFALRPLDELRAALGHVRNGQRKQITETFPSEVQPLVDDLNGLLTSTGELVQRARTQAGNIAHGLKTPLAILSDEAHRLERDGLSRPAATIVAQVKKMQTHIDYQITRARAAAAHITLGNSASLAVAADEVTMALQRLYRARAIKVSKSLDSGLRVACDRQDLNEILANLLDNAFKHAGSRVEISAGIAKSGSNVVILIDDDGPGLPAEAREIVFNVGERWDSQEPGSGLGLAIARDLARLYGGDVSLAESSLGGLRVELVMATVARD